VVKGNDNTIEAVRVVENAGPAGIKVAGDGNRVLGNAVGDVGRGNGGHGIHVLGAGNLLAGNGVFASTGDGISVSRGTALSPNVIRLNAVGGPQRSNGGNGVTVGGTGNGAAAPVELERNTAQANMGAGFVVAGTGHQLAGNVSGGAGVLSNAGCEFDVAAGNVNATGNVSGTDLIPGASGSAFPTGCR
jgi:hypothetical protein